MPRATKTTKPSSNAMENMQEESSAHEVSPSSDQEQDTEAFSKHLRYKVSQTCSCPT